MRKIYKGFLIVLLAIGSITNVNAQYATGGTSTYRDQVLWLTWGGGENGTHDIAISNNTTTSYTYEIASGLELKLTAVIDNISGGSLTSYRPGTWTGDVLDDRYNINGTGTNNQLICGIACSSQTVHFRITCSALLNGSPYDIVGLVMADAESINATTEYIQGTADGNWYVVEMAKNLGAGSYYAQKTNSSLQTLRLGTGTDNNTAAVSFLSFTTPASSKSVDFAIKGGGKTAIAIGFLMPNVDFGDAPTSYGNAIHFIKDLTFSDDNIPVDGTQYDLNTSSYNPGGLVSPPNMFLGNTGPDAEKLAQSDTTATGDDIFLSSGAEEDAFSYDSVIFDFDGGKTVSYDIPYVGDGTIAGWIDFDRSGTFDSDERAEATVSGSGNATLTWTVTNDVRAGVSYVRLRFASNASKVVNSTGLASDGEVEDKRIEIDAISDVSVSKTVDNTTPKVGSQVVFTLAATNNGPSDATGVIVTDVIPEGYTYVSNDAPSGVTYSSGTVTWNVGDLAKDASVSLQITVSVNP